MATAVKLKSHTIVKIIHISRNTAVLGTSSMYNTTMAFYVLTICCIFISMPRSAVAGEGGGKSGVGGWGYPVGVRGRPLARAESRVFNRPKSWGLLQPGQKKDWVI